MAHKNPDENMSVYGFAMKEAKGFCLILITIAGFVFGSFFSQVALYSNDNESTAGGAGERRGDREGIGEGEGRVPTERWVRVIVELERPCLVRYRGGFSGIAAPPKDVRGKMDLHSSESRAYLALLDSDQRAFWQRLLHHVPGARRHHVYRILFNGMTVKVPANKLDVISGLPGVVSARSTDRVLYVPTLDTSLDLIHAPEYWEANGGVTLAGIGVKVAVIDSGIDQDNPLFNPAGFMYPPGYPKGATQYTTPKVIAARAYFRPDDPVDLSRDEQNPVDHSGHGSHCAGIIAGSYGTVFDLGGVQLNMSGVAPAAQLMNYKVFYRGESGLDGAREPELMAAFEDAVADGADVISNSWGGPDVFGPWDPALAVYENAIEAGCVVVFAAGNEGPGDGSVASPGGYDPFLTVGATVTGRRFANYLDITAPEPVPDELRGVLMSIGRISPSFTDGVGPAGFVSSTVVDGGVNVDGCGGFSPGALDGSIVLIIRGNCNFSTKVQNAEEAGAVGAIIRNHMPGEGAFSMQGENVSIPAVMVSYENGAILQDWAESHSDAQVFLGSGLVPYTVTDEEGVVVGFSSRGPTAWAAMKPEVVAPGTLILSADAHRVGSSLTRPWGLKGGTSMACPHVSGVAALLKVNNQSWGHHEIKAAIVGTASPEGLRTYDGTGSAGACERGSGQVDLLSLLELNLLALPSALSLGEVAPSESVSATVELESVAGAGENGAAVTVNWHGDEWPAGVSVEPGEGSRITLNPEGATELEVTLLVGEEVELQDLTGHLELLHDQGGVTRIPYHVRIVPKEPDVDLLLVDLSFYSENETFDFGTIYETEAEKAGLSYHVAADLYSDDTAGVPPLPKLLRYRALLVFTGDDLWYHFSEYGVRSLDRISSYAARGGGLIIMGQGPLRSTGHTRTSALAGAVTDGSLPLYDENTGLLVPLNEYKAVVVEMPFLVTAPLELYNGFGGGDLRFLGEIIQAGEQDVEPWSHPVLKMTEGPFQGIGAVSVAYDPYPWYITDSLAQAHSHRVLFFGFGLEVVKEPEGVEDDPGGGEGEGGDGDGEFVPGSRAELLSRSWEWVSERVFLDVEVLREDTHVTLTAHGHSTNSSIEEYYFDFGDGSEPSYTAENVVTHEYEQYGTYPITVYAWSELGAADVVRTDVYVAPGTQGTGDAGVVDGGGDGSDAEIPSDASHDLLPGPGGCRCTSFGRPAVRLNRGAKRGTSSGTVSETPVSFFSFLCFLLFCGVLVFRRSRPTNVPD